MADESELIKLREELKRSRRRAAFGFVILVLALVLCLVYSFVQQFAAEKNAEEALRQKNLADRAHLVAEQNAEETRRQEAIAREQTAAAIRAREQSVAAIEECAKRLNSKSKGKK
jgi:Flp pilus assembly protein TadG